VSALSIANTDHRMTKCLSAQHQTVLVTFFGFRSHFKAVQKECATPPHVNPTSRYIIGYDQF